MNKVLLTLMTFTLMVLVYLVVITAEPMNKNHASDIAFVELFVPQSFNEDVRDRCIEHAAFVLFRSGQYHDDPKVQGCAREIVKRVSEYRKL